jgi:hypothetical protein
VQPKTVCALCLVFRVNQTALRSTEHSIADLEFKEKLLNANHIICGVGIFKIPVDFTQKNV